MEPSDRLANKTSSAKTRGDRWISYLLFLNAAFALWSVLDPSGIDRNLMRNLLLMIGFLMAGAALHPQVSRRRIAHALRVVALLSLGAFWFLRWY